MRREINENIILEVRSCVLLCATVVFLSQVSQVSSFSTLNEHTINVGKAKFVYVWLYVCAIR